jgi:Fe-S-cluster-containing dehydrogenase component/CRP-like cAMP-binding protein
MAKARVKVSPPAALEPQSGDEELTLDELQKISLFAGLKEQPGIIELPGTLVLRHYHKGDIICRLGEPGWTAFYILTRPDMLTLRQGQLELTRHQAAAAQRVQVLEADIAELRLQSTGSDDHVARVFTALPPNSSPIGAFKRLFGQRTGRGPNEPRYQAFLTEGELFGEMSCLYRTPRSATVVAERDCYMLEFLRNVFDKMLTNRNKAFKEQVDEKYRSRVLELHLRALPLFRDLPSADIDRLRAQVTLEAFEPGELICDEHDESDCMYIIRSGFVQILKNVSFLLTPEDIADWSALCTALRAGEAQTGTPQRIVWDTLTEEVRALISGGAALAELDDSDRHKIIRACNELLKQAKLAAAVEFKDVLANAGLADEQRQLPSTLKKWLNHQRVCNFNRRLLSATYPSLFPLPTHSPGEVRILNYRGERELIGEIGLVTGGPRTATCVAYDHPDSRFGRVETVKISKDLFAEILAASPKLAEHVKGVVNETVRQTSLSTEKPLWDELNASVRSDRFNALGLIQGQKLMLIDLDRCTRCDECVKACVATHPDRRSRLFLDGPVFKTILEGERRSFLVPATCRQCKDPVCLIGCPVGSIHKGENGQIVIEDWCIGCSRCALQCPYNAIQMHAIGILPKKSHGWRYRAGPEQPDKLAWYDPQFNDHGWIRGPSPFYYDRELRERLYRPEEVHFRHSFDLDSATLTKGISFHLQVLSLAPSVTVWVNGSEVIHKPTEQGAPLKPTDKGERWNLEAYLMPGHSQRTIEVASADGGPRPVLRLGRNVVAARVTAIGNSTDVLFELGVFQVSKPVVPGGLSGEFTQDLVMNRAVVCDMCSERFGQRPACVNACPHDAAMRIESRKLFH